MSGPLPLALAILAVLALVGLVHLLGFNRRPVLADPQQAIALADSLHGGFQPADMVLACDGGGALLADAQGRIAVVAPIGAHFLVRLADAGWQVEPVDAGSLAIAGADFSARLDLGPQRDRWLLRLPGQSGAAS